MSSGQVASCNLALRRTDLVEYRNIGIHGFYLGRLTALRPDLVEQAGRDVLRLWEGGIVRPIVGAEFPLEQAGEAHRVIEGRKTTGKVVLIP